MSTATETMTGAANGVGTSPQRPDGLTKVRGEFAYSSDMWHEDMLWGATLRSPHPYARITGVDIGEALVVPGVYAVLTHSDVPGVNRYGLEHQDQPVLAVDVVRSVLSVVLDHENRCVFPIRAVAYGLHNAPEAHIVTGDL